MNYVELHIGDYDKATAHLTACEDGIYGRLMRRYYDTEAPLPLDLKALQRLVRARSREEKEAVQTILDEFFHQQVDGWHHKRCDEEIAKFLEKREKAKRSAEARWNKSERNANACADDMRTHSECNAHQSPDTRHHQEQKPARPSPSAAQPARDDDEAVPGEQDLPSWVPKPLWREFYRHRAVIRKPLSIPGQRQVVARLVELSEQGHDIAASLRQTMAAGLAIPVKPRDHDHEHENRSTGRKLSAVEQVEQAIRDRREREREGGSEPLAALGHG